MSEIISGIAPAEEGKDWFLIDKSGSFSLLSPIMAEIWLVGGGSDGEDGFVSSSGSYFGGKGGDGGAVFKFGKIKISGNTVIDVNIADVNNPWGTWISFNGKRFRVGDAGSSGKLGGRGGIIDPDGGTVRPFNGSDGVLTPYGFVGSSGGGGICAVISFASVKSTAMSRGGNGAGGSRNYLRYGINWEEIKKYNPSIDAVNYGCGGGGNTFCHGEEDVGVKSHGKGGCVIVKYSVIENDENSPECTVRYWGKSKSDSDKKALQERIMALTQELETANAKNLELKKKAEKL
ncbi:MAG: hypothetical protein HDT44_01200 [Ruminococcaceae bacterium]|nr:hypothetical protein [Oscillospiraceae bacterium]